MSKLPIITHSVNIKQGSTWSGYYGITTATIEYTGVTSDRGDISGTGGVYPSSGGSGAAGAILAGDYWTVITGSGTIGDKSVIVGDILLALEDTPGSTDSKWTLISKVDVTTDDWILTFKNNDTEVIVLSTDNGLLTTSNTNQINYSIPYTTTENMDVQNLYGELRNETTKKTLFGVVTAVEGSANG